MSQPPSRWLTALFGLSLVTSLACAGARGADDIAPTIRFGIYDLAVTNLAMEAMLVVNEPSEAYVRDTIWVHHGGVFECQPLLRRGRSVCGGFTLALADSDVIALYRDCASREEMTSYTVRDPVTGQIRDVSSTRNVSDCSDADVKVTRRVPGGG